jgi:hypothetical protein
MSSGMLLDKIVSVYRKGLTGTSAYSDTVVYSTLKCAIIPISSLDLSVPYARESTHVVWTPRWAALRKEDQLRYAVQPPDPMGDIRQYIYVINGYSPYRLGGSHITYYARELD